MTVCSNNLCPSNSLAPGDHKVVVHQGSFDGLMTRWTLIDASVIEDVHYEGSKCLKIEAGGRAQQASEVSSGVVSVWLKTEGATQIDIIFSHVTWTVFADDAVDWINYVFSTTTEGMTIDNVGDSVVYIDSISPTDEVVPNIGTVVISETTNGGIVILDEISESIVIVESKRGSIVITTEEDNG